MEEFERYDLDCINCGHIPIYEGEKAFICKKCGHADLYEETGSCPECGLDMLMDVDSIEDVPDVYECPCGAEVFISSYVKVEDVEICGLSQRLKRFFIIIYRKFLSSLNWILRKSV